MAKNKGKNKPSKKAIQKTQEAVKVANSSNTLPATLELDVLDESTIKSPIKELAEESSCPRGIVLDSVINAHGKLMFTKIKTINPKNNKELIILDYRPEIKREPFTEVEFDFDTYNGKLVPINVQTITEKSELKQFLTPLEDAPKIEPVYMTAVLAGLASSPNPSKHFKELGIVGINPAGDIVYVSP